MEPNYRQTPGNRPSRHPERAQYDAATVHEILDQGLIAHVGFVRDGLPQVLPMLYVREDRTLYLHGSTGAHLNRIALRRGGIRLSAEITLFDELVLARSVFDHSVNYRSLVVAGEGRIVADRDEKASALEALVERLVPGRSRDAREPSDDELRQTAVLAVPLEDVSAKVRSGDPIDEPEDLDRPCWAGVLPLTSRWGEPRPAANLDERVELPSYLAALANASLSR